MPSLLSSSEQAPLAQPNPPTLAALQAHFLEILPRIEMYANVCFHHVRCPGRKEDNIQEAVALAWKWFVVAARKGKDGADFVTSLATFAVRHVRSGRGLCGQQKSKDVLSLRAQRNKGFTIEPLNTSICRSHESILADPHGQERMDSFEERLRDNTSSPVPDQAAFRIDFPRWLASLEQRNRQVAQDMARDETTLELARKHQVSQGRISQLRRELHRDWLRFHGELV